MMKNYKNHLIALLTALLVISISTQQAQSAPTQKNVTKVEFQKLVLLIAKESAKQDSQIKELWNCVNSLEVDPGGSGREVTCP